jgi:SNF2 family DNA or RNA helicase
MSDALEEIRKIRALENPKLKPSPFIKSKFIDEQGNEIPIEIRNYQKQAVLNMVVMPTMVNALDTGLGKTLVSLVSIGYIWIQEPEYVPIIITNKSALFQWGKEVDKFLTGIDYLIVSGNPLERNLVYEKFFNDYDKNKKRLIILTYDNIFRDLRESIITEQIKGSGSGKFKKETSEAKKNFDSSKIELEDYRIQMSNYFLNFPQMIQEYASSQIRGDSVKESPGWSSNEQKWIDGFLKRKNVYEEFQEKYEQAKSLSHPTKKVNGILDYIKELKKSNPDAKLILVMDEMHKVKNYKSQIHQAVKELSLQCERLYGLTATPVKNHLIEFFSIFKILKPSLFPKITHFMNEYCVTKLQSIGGGRQVPVIVGFKNLKQFVVKIEPYYLSRKKYEVAKELPQLITREIPCELTDVQEELYGIAETGLLGTDPDSEESEILKSLVLCQQAVDSPYLIADENGEPFEGPSSKEDMILELLENDLDEKKVIIFSRFERMISRIEKILDEEKIKCVRITGKENKPSEREKAKNLFQDTNSGINVILITTAGSESINLQSAEYLIFVDSPFSFGDYIQIVGRMIRIGSTHQNVVAFHLVAERQNGKKTIDHHVLDILKKKKRLIDQVAGSNLPNALDFKSGTKDIFSSMVSGTSEKPSTSKPTKIITSSKKIKRSQEKAKDNQFLDPLDL